MSGTQRGKEGQRVQEPKGAVICAALSFIEAKKPNTILSEKAPALAARHKDATQCLIKSIEEYGYHVWWHIICTKDCGAPQAHNMWRMLAVKKSCCRARMAGSPRGRSRWATACVRKTLPPQCCPRGGTISPSMSPRSTATNAYAKVASKGYNFARVTGGD